MSIYKPILFFWKGRNLSGKEYIMYILKTGIGS